MDTKKRFNQFDYSKRTKDDYHTNKGPIDLGPGRGDGFFVAIGQDKAQAVDDCPDDGDDK